MKEEKIMDELERELGSLGEELRKASPPSSLIPATLKILEGNAVPSWHMSLRVRLRRMKQSPLLQFSEFTLSLLVLFALIRLFSFTGDPVFNVIKISLLIFSFTVGSLFILNPEKMVGIDRKIIGNLLNRGAVATPLQEIILFRVQGLYFILIAFFVCKL